MTEATGERQISMGEVSWFDPVKRFGFVKLRAGHGDAFLHFDVLKNAGFYFVPRGTSVSVRVEVDQQGRQRVIELFDVDCSTAREGEPPPLPRKTRAERNRQQSEELRSCQERVRASLTVTEGLLAEAEEMTSRHLREREDDAAREDDFVSGESPEDPR